MCVWFGQYKQNQEPCHREGPELPTDDLMNLTHGEEMSASGGRMRDSEKSKTIAHVSHEAAFSAEVDKGQHFVTRLSIKNKGRWTLVCISQAIQIQHWYLH